MSTNTEESLFTPFGNYRYEIGITYCVKSRSVRGVHALLNPVDCEYTLVLTVGEHKHMFRVTADEQVARLDPKPNEFSHYTKLELFSFFYTAETFTITNLVDLRARVDTRGRTTYTDDKVVTCHHPSKEEHIHFHLDCTYQLTELALWKVRALERPLDCRYDVVLESATMPSKRRTIAPGSMPELVGLHNWDKITIADIRKAP